MSDSGMVQPVFGVGAILSQSLSILFSNLPLVILFAGAPIVSVTIAGESALNAWFEAGFYDPASNAWVEAGFYDPASEFAAVGLMFVFLMVGYGVASALITLLAYDRAIGNPARPTAYFGAALIAAPRVVLMSILIAITAMAGFVALIVPGLYVLTIWMAAIPVVVMERQGLGALSRSADLTRGYRWPLFGLLIITIVIESVFEGIGESVSLLVGFDIDDMVGVSLVAVFSSLSTGFAAISAALAYARLRDLKEGVGVDDLADVFS